MLKVYAFSYKRGNYHLALVQSLHFLRKQLGAQRILQGTVTSTASDFSVLLMPCKFNADVTAIPKYLNYTTFSSNFINSNVRGVPSITTVLV